MDELIVSLVDRLTRIAFPPYLNKGPSRCSSRFLFGAVLFFSVASFVLGQQNTGALKGTVTDQLGSLVVGAKVTLRNARGVSTTAKQIQPAFMNFAGSSPEPTK